ncbi:MAG: hypothetical protein ACRDRA_17515 [Pseudonocardiaceae bacterium]
MNAFLAPVDRRRRQPPLVPRDAGRGRTAPRPRWAAPLPRAARSVRHRNGTTEVPVRSSGVVSLCAHDASALTSVGLDAIDAQDGARE